MRQAWKVVEEFEQALADYCGAHYAVAVDSCTSALKLCFYSVGHQELTLPKRTYVGVPQAAKAAGHTVRFVDHDWSKQGFYGIPTKDGPIIDSARCLYRGMFQSWVSLVCLSFHYHKHLPIGRGGAILCDDEEDYEWFLRARYDGRDQRIPLSEQKTIQWGMRCPMFPEEAARGLLLLANLPDYNDPIPGEYPDLSQMEWT